MTSMNQTETTLRAMALTLADSLTLEERNDNCIQDAFARFNERPSKKALANIRTWVAEARKDTKMTSSETITAENINDAIETLSAENLIKATAAAHLAGVKLALAGAKVETVEACYEAVRARFRRDGSTLPEGWAIARAVVKGWEAIARA